MTTKPSRPKRTNAEVYSPSSRKEVAKALKRATIYYLSKKMYSCHEEFGVGDWGNKRLDLLAMNTKCVFIGVEIKSCPSDYRTDTKWIDYLNTGVFHKFYFCITMKMQQNKKFFKTLCNDLKPHGVGIMVLGEYGRIKVVKSAKTREVNNEALQRVIIKMAWRGGESKRTIKQTKRVYIEE